MLNLEWWLRIVDPEPVLIDRQACLPARHVRSNCRACIQACPDKALRFQQGRVMVDTSACSRCGICGGACPTAAVSIRGINEQMTKAGPAIACSQAASKPEGAAVLPCLGWLTADHLVGMGLKHPSVNLICGECSTCRWAAGGAASARAVEQANAILAGIADAGKVQLGTRFDAKSAPGTQVSRRQLLSGWRTNGLHTAAQLIPELPVDHGHLSVRVPSRRAAWLDLLGPVTPTTAERPLPEGPWRARTANDRCTGCDICVTFCPTGALASSETGGEWVLSHQPSICVGCATCVSVCPVGAVGEEPLLLGRMLSGERREIARMVLRRCRVCYREIPGEPGSPCPYCAAERGQSTEP